MSFLGYLTFYLIHPWFPQGIVLTILSSDIVPGSRIRHIRNVRRICSVVGNQTFLVQPLSHLHSLFSTPPQAIGRRLLQGRRGKRRRRRPGKLLSLHPRHLILCPPQSFFSLLRCLPIVYFHLSPIHLH